MNRMPMYARKRLFYLALAVAVLPFVTFNLSYLIAVSQVHVPFCFTYLDGCTSVSSTGRQAPEMWVFKPGVLALAFCLALHWHYSAETLSKHGVRAARARTLRTLALVSVMALTIYAVTLGLPDEQFGKLRRVGTHGFAFSSWLTQIAFVVFYRPVRIEATRAAYRWLVLATAALLVVGIASETAKAMGWPRKVTNNIAAWNAFLMMTAYYLVLARIWWHHNKSSGLAASPNE
ncbi:MAG: hypothetical protein ACR2QS_03755 [Woeseiaceae bacterium]